MTNRDDVVELTERLLQLEIKVRALQASSYNFQGSDAQTCQAIAANQIACIAHDLMVQALVSVGITAPQEFNSLRTLGFPFRALPDLENTCYRADIAHKSRAPALPGPVAFRSASAALSLADDAFQFAAKQFEKCQENSANADGLQIEWLEELKSDVTELAHRLDMVTRRAEALREKLPTDVAVVDLILDLARRLHAGSLSDIARAEGHRPKAPEESRQLVLRHLGPSSEFGEPGAVVSELTDLLETIADLVFSYQFSTPGIRHGAYISAEKQFDLSYQALYLVCKILNAIDPD